MDLKEYLDHLNRGEKVEGGSEVHRFMHEASQEALRITSELNGSYHTPEEIRQLMSRLTGKEIDETFRMFPPFYTDCGKISLWEKMFLLTAAVIFRIREESPSETDADRT